MTAVLCREEKKRRYSSKEEEDGKRAGLIVLSVENPFELATCLSSSSYDVSIDSEGNADFEGKRDSFGNLAMNDIIFPFFVN
ncbi:MAG: hypothetical protein ACM3JI_03685 [Anaerolineae bacterium]